MNQLKNVLMEIEKDLDKYNNRNFSFTFKLDSTDKGAIYVLRQITETIQNRLDKTDWNYKDFKSNALIINK